MAAPAKFVSPTSMLRNNSALSVIRSLSSALTAAAAGVLGVTGIMGFLLYLIMHLAVSGLLLLRIGWRPSSYFPNTSLLGFALGGLSENLIMYMFVWTLAYALVHIY